MIIVCACMHAVSSCVEMALSMHMQVLETEVYSKVCGVSIDPVRSVLYS